MTEIIALIVTFLLLLPKIHNDATKSVVTLHPRLTNNVTNNVLSSQK